MLYKILAPLVVLLVVGLTSCDAINKSRTNRSSKSKTEAKAAMKTGGGAAKAARAQPSPRARKASSWLAEQKSGPTLPAAVRGAPFGAHAKEAKGITLRSSITGVGTMLGHNHRELEIKVAFNTTSDRVAAYRISVDGKTLKRLHALWGPPQRVHGQPMWFNAKAGLRVRRRKDYKMLTRMKQGLAASTGISKLVKVHELIFEPYIPFKTLLGSGERLAFLPRVIVGQSVAQIKAAYPKRFARDKELAELQAGELQFPPTEYTVPASELFSSATDVALEAEKGRVVSFAFEVGYKTEQHKAEIYSLLTQKYGKPKRGEPGERYVGKPPRIFTMGGGLKLTAYKSLMNKSVVIRVSRAR